MLSVQIVDIDSGELLEELPYTGGWSRVARDHQEPGTIGILTSGSARLMDFVTLEVRTLDVSGHVVSIDQSGELSWWDAARLAQGTPGRTNLRVCEGTDDVVPVVPYPTPDQRWAPAEACP